MIWIGQDLMFNSRIEIPLSELAKAGDEAYLMNVEVFELLIRGSIRNRRKYPAIEQQREKRLAET